MLNDGSITPAAARRERQAREMRARLIEAALALFARKGFDATTIKDIAQAAGVAQGLPHHYFHSKEGLLWAIVEEHDFLPQLRQTLTAAAGQPVGAALRDVALAFHSFLRAEKPFIRLLLRELQTNAPLADAWDRMLDQGKEPLRRFVAARIEAGELRPHNVEATLLGLMYPLVTLHVPGMGMPGDPEALIADMVDTLARGITA